MMTPQQIYLAWVRTTHPKLYYAALRQLFTRRGHLGSLGDDLTASITPDLTSSETIGAGVDTSISSDVSDAVNSAYNAGVSSASTNQGGSTDFFSSLANAITSIAPTVVQTQAQENLLAINTQRAQRGLPPLTASGYPVTGAMLSPTTSNVTQMEAALAAGSAGGVMPMLLIGGVGLALFALVGRRRG